MLDGQTIWWPLLLSTLAGLSTTIGAVLAITRTPDESFLAFLLGTAMGVMATVSGAELWWHKAVQRQDWLGVSLAVAAGAAAFALLDPLLPKPPEPQQLLLHEADKQVEPDAVLQLRLSSQAEVKLATGVKWQGSGVRQHSHAATSPRPSSGLQRWPSTGSNGAAAAAAAQQEQPLLQHKAASGSAGCCEGVPSVVELSMYGSSNRPAAGDAADSLAQLRAHHSGLMRLGLLMAITMSLHNLPEGCAVAFSAFTDFGATMALAIAVHNIPEGLIIAVPVYAATNSKTKAIALAAASGLSEPIGALFALFVLRPFVASLERLDYVLAAVGGVMLAVCGLELWPEARKCKQDVRMLQGVLLGAVAMGWTLLVGV
uniref:Uncharacterized protein n=1 Tax=Tetradesmus obliquus TaxID=3088 RepID=A0A383WD89_TETOB|eukprot:jgi/Sobl393_1/235/SZX74974.1